MDEQHLPISLFPVAQNRSTPQEQEEKATSFFRKFMAVSDRNLGASMCRAFIPEKNDQQSFSLGTAQVQRRL